MILLYDMYNVLYKDQSVLFFSYLYFINKWIIKTFAYPVLKGERNCNFSRVNRTF